MSGSSIFATVRKRPDLGAILIAIALFIVYALADPGGLFSWFTMENIVHFSAIFSFVAIGQTLLLISREIDLSVGSVYGLAGIGLILLEREREVGVVPAAVLVLLGAAAIGLPPASLHGCPPRSRQPRPSPLAQAPPKRGAGYSGPPPRYARRMASCCE